jgi:hypothetical protein
MINNELPVALLRLVLGNGNTTQKTCGMREQTSPAKGQSTYEAF